MLCKLTLDKNTEVYRVKELSGCVLNLVALYIYTVFMEKSLTIVCLYLKEIQMRGNFPYVFSESLTVFTQDSFQHFLSLFYFLNSCLPIMDVLLWMVWKGKNHFRYCTFDKS